MALNKLYRDGDRGMIAGVCAGLADFFELDVRMTRIVVAVSAVFFPSVIVAYIVLAVLLRKKSDPDRRGAAAEPEQRRKKRKKRRHRDDSATTDFESRDRAQPHVTLSRVRRRFRDLDARLQRLEKYVTSERFRLDREFEGLRDGPGSTHRRTP